MYLSRRVSSTVVSLFAFAMLFTTLAEAKSVNVSTYTFERKLFYSADDRAVQFYEGVFRHDGVDKRIYVLPKGGANQIGADAINAWSAGREMLVEQGEVLVSLDTYAADVAKQFKDGVEEFIYAPANFVDDVANDYSEVSNLFDFLIATIYVPYRVVENTVEGVYGLTKIPTSWARPLFARPLEALVHVVKDGIVAPVVKVVWLGTGWTAIQIWDITTVRALSQTAYNFGKTWATHSISYDDLAAVIHHQVAEELSREINDAAAQNDVTFSTDAAYDLSVEIKERVYDELGAHTPLKKTTLFKDYGVKSLSLNDINQITTETLTDFELPEGIDLDDATLAKTANTAATAIIAKLDYFIK